MKRVCSRFPWLFEEEEEEEDKDEFDRLVSPTSTVNETDGDDDSVVELVCIRRACDVPVFDFQNEEEEHEEEHERVQDINENHDVYASTCYHEEEKEEEVENPWEERRRFQEMINRQRRVFYEKMQEINALGECMDENKTLMINHGLNMPKLLLKEHCSFAKEMVTKSMELTTFALLYDSASCEVSVYNEMKQSNVFNIVLLLLLLLLLLC